MAKQQSLHRVRMYDPSTYRSVEEKVMKALEPAGKGIVDFRNTFIKNFYGTVLAPLRALTSIRRGINEQSLFAKARRGRETTSSSWGVAVGLVAGIGADMAGIYYSLEQAGKGNYIPLAVLGISNLGFGIYELGRLKTSRREHLGLQKYRVWQKKKRIEEEEKAKKKKTKSKSSRKA